MTDSDVLAGGILGGWIRRKMVEMPGSRA